MVDKTLISNPTPGYSNMKYIMKRPILVYNDDASRPPTGTDISKWGKVYYEPLDPSWNVDDSTSSPLLQPSSELIGDWFLVGASGNILPKPPLVKFEDGSLSLTYCNNKGMNFVRMGDGISISSGFSTLMMCS